MTTSPPLANIQKRRRRSKWLGAFVGVAAVSLLASSCGVSSQAAPKKTTSSSGVSSLAGTTITLEGPNQWNTSGSSFGAAWDSLVASFKKVSGITVKTTVLPLSSFGQVESTQLAAGTGSDLMFDQATYKPYMVHHLQSYLKKPNPFIPGNKQWISVFRKEYYGLHNPTSIDDEGNVNWVPFDLVSAGVFTNENAFKKAGVGSITTFKQLIDACPRFKKAGYTPFAMNDSNLGIGNTYITIFNMLAAGQGWYTKLNVYNAAGAHGSSAQLTAKDITRAVALGLLKASSPVEVETLKLMKQFYGSCATTDWSGITGLSGSVVGLRQFAAGKAAMAWGEDFGYGALTSAKFKVGTMPFPTVTKATTSLSTNFPAQFGASTLGTSYLIPAHVSGKQLAASIRFLQFVSTPKYIQPWLDATGGIPAVNGATSPTAGFAKGPWGETPKVGGGPLGPPSVQTVALFDTYLLGDRSLANEESYLQGLWEQQAAYNITTNKWQSASWAKDVKGG